MIPQGPTEVGFFAANNGLGNRAHPLHQCFQAGAHLFRGELPASTVAGQHPSEWVAQQVPQRFPLSRPGIPAGVAKSGEINQIETPIWLISPFSPLGPTHPSQGSTQTRQEIWF